MGIIRIRIFFIFLYLLLMTAVDSDTPAAAQDSPSASVPQAMTSADMDMLSVDFDEAFGMFNNDFLSDIVKLTYQINLLEKMVSRQAELQKIKESFEGMGAKFEEPAPPRGICAQLPVNATCVKFYPELYADKVSQRRAYYDELKAKAAAANPAAAPITAAVEGESKEAKAAREAAIAAKAEAERREREEQAEKEARQKRYLWTDITCIGGSCRGVLIGSDNSGFRATVREGSRLSDGTRVEAVSANGIRINIAGDRINVRPAPSPKEAAPVKSAGFGTGPDGFGNDEGPTLADFGNTAKAAAAGISDQPENAEAAGEAEGGEAAAEDAADNTDTAATSNTGATGQTMAEPALGPSGLF